MTLKFTYLTQINRDLIIEIGPATSACLRHVLDFSAGFATRAGFEQDFDNRVL